MRVAVVVGVAVGVNVLVGVSVRVGVGVTVGGGVSMGGGGAAQLRRMTGRYVVLAISPLRGSG